MRKDILEWFSEPEGRTIKDKLSIYIAKIVYLFIRLSIRILLGKERRDRYFKNHNLTLYRFMPHDAIVKYDGYFIYIRRKQAEDLDLLKSSHEFGIIKLLQDNLKVDDIFIDIGAHVGKYVILASLYIKRGMIIAIEPHPETFRVLKTNIELNKLNIKCLNLAISNRNGYDKLYISKRAGANSFLLYNTTNRFVEVKTRTLDALIKELKIDRIDWLLIDVEGVEDRVLQGARNTLSMINNVIVEAHTKENLEFITQFLENNNFEVMVVDDSPIPHIVGKKRAIRGNNL